MQDTEVKIENIEDDIIRSLHRVNEPNQRKEVEHEEWSKEKQLELELRRRHNIEELFRHP